MSLSALCHDCSKSLMCDNYPTELEMIYCDTQLHTDDSGDVKHVLNIAMVVLCIICFFKRMHSTVSLYKNPGGKPLEGLKCRSGCLPRRDGPGFWFMSGKGPKGSNRGRGKPVPGEMPGVGLMPPGINGRFGKRSLCPPERNEPLVPRATSQIRASETHLQH